MTRISSTVTLVPALRSVLRAPWSAVPPHRLRTTLALNSKHFTKTCGGTALQRDPHEKMITRKPPLLIFLLTALFILAVICLRPSDALAQGGAAPTHSDILRGEYGRYRANNDLLYYHLDVRVDPNRKYLVGSTLMRFKMLKDDNRIQLDLHEALKVDKIEYSVNSKSPKIEQLKYTRDSGALFVDFPETLKSGQTYEIQVFYSGYPLEQGRFGGIAFKKDPPVGHGLTQRAKAKAQVSGGPTKINGATKSSR